MGDTVPIKFKDGWGVMPTGITQSGLSYD